MTTLGLLEKARELISDETRWTTCTNSRDETGLPVHPTSYEAKCWCISGAIWKCSEDNELLAGKAWDALLNEAEKAGYETPPAANDDGGHEIILAIVDATIERLKDVAQ